MKRRQTIQKLKILEYLKSVKTHPTAEMVFNEVVKEIPTITLATVYRNLNLLAQSGEILKIEVNNEFRFDADISHHQHCVCKKCGSICDIFQKEISTYALNKIKFPEFKFEGVTIIFDGLCKNCLQSSI